MEVSESPTPPSPTNTKAAADTKSHQKKQSGGFGALMVNLFSLALTGLVIIAVFFCWLLYHPQASSGTHTLLVERGSAIQKIGNQVSDLGFLSNPLLFRFASFVLANDRLQAGEYEIKPEASLADIIRMMRDGQSVVRRLMVMEGLTSQQIIAELASNPILTGEVTDVPPEGTLLPDTYHYTYGDKRADIVARMTKAAEELEQSLWDSRAPNLPLKSWQEVLVMASLIEKETGKKPEERARVAGVFYNRLRLGMRMQSDPTTIYAIAGGKGELGRSLTRDDLNFPSPFNTYTSDGLPPTPICNPGRAAIEAALHPESHDFLYFVADGTGGHAFARDLAEHNRNAARWYALQKP